MQSGICNYTFRCHTIGKKTHQHSSRIGPNSAVFLLIAYLSKYLFNNAYNEFVLNKTTTRSKFTI